MKKRILIAGYYGYHNTGDEAILAVLIKDLKDIDLDVEICVLSGDPEYTRQLHQVNAIPQSDMPGIIEKARTSNCLVVGGGGIFQDYWGADKNTLLTGDHAGIPFYSCLPILGWLLEKPVLLYSVGVGPLFSREAEELTRLSFELASCATVRDQESQKILNSLGLPSRKVSVAADCAFNLHADKEKACDLLQQVAPNANRPMVAICLRNWEVTGSKSAWEAELASSLDAFIDNTHCSLLFIPFHDLPASLLTDDSSAANKVITKMKQQSAVIQLRAGFSPEVVSGILSQCDLVVGMRYHSIVFAASAGVPVVSLAYDSKVAHLMKKLGLGNYDIELSEVTSDRLLSCMNRAWINRQLTRKNLLEKVDGIKHASHINQKAVRELMGAENRRLIPSPHIDSFFKELSLRQSGLLSKMQQAIPELNKRIQEKDQTIHARDMQVLSDQQAIQELNKRIQEKDQALHARDMQVLSDQKAIQELNERIQEKDQTIHAHDKQMLSDQQATQELNERIQEKDQAIQRLSDQITTETPITKSTAWKLILVLWEIRKWLLPPGSIRERIAKSIWGGLLGHGPHKRRLSPPPPFDERYVVEDNSQVTLYTDDDTLLTDYKNRKRLQNDLPDHLQISLIASLKNEAGNVKGWLQDIEHQTRTPDELIVIDGGSSDGSDKIFEKISGQLLFPARLIRAPGTNPAAARNIAVENARYPIIAVTDFGCHPTPDWLEKLIQPFKLEPETKVSAGFYNTITRAGKSLSGMGLWPSPRQIDPQSFLPSSRSVIFRKDALYEVGGHPEWLTRTGDDTYLDLELKRFGGKLAFVPEAVVNWIAPETFAAYLRKMFEWAVGDGESGVHAVYYWRYLLHWSEWIIFTMLTMPGSLALIFLRVPTYGLWSGLCLGLWVGAFLLLALREGLSPLTLVQKSFGQAAQILGFLRGTRNRDKVEEKRAGMLKGVFFILSGVPIDDTGGGARSTQIALELLRLGYSVVFIHKFPKNESKELSLSFAHINLYLYSIKDFQLNKFIQSHAMLLKDRTPSVLVEFPLPDFLEILQIFRQDYDATIIYDLIDDWKTSLGAQWYTTSVEDEIIASSQLLVATVPLLAKRLEAASGRKFLLLPNAVNDRLFNPDIEYMRPLDMPESKRIVMYIGALWGEWFDWKLINQTAKTYPGFAFVLIGDYRGYADHLEPNIFCVGLKAQRDLPAYLAYADVAIIPWKVNEITQATSPLKVYEYLSMRLPVVVPQLDPLDQLPGVYPARDKEEFIELVGKVSKGLLDQNKVEAFIRLNNWGARVNTLNERVKLIQNTTTGIPQA